MVIILNGSCGVGKSTLTTALQESLDRAVALDGDYLGDIHPFDLYSQERILYLNKTVEFLVKFHQEHGHTNFVYNYVFEESRVLADLVQRLQALGQTVHCYWIRAAWPEQKQRILGRSTDQVDWELERAPQLNAILEAESQRGFIGLPLDSTGKSPQDLAREILEDLGL